MCLAALSTEPCKNRLHLPEPRRKNYEVFAYRLNSMWGKYFADMSFSCYYCLTSVLWHCWLGGGRKGILPVVCLERGADLHMAQRMPLPLTVSCFSKIQIGLPFWYRLTRVVLDKGSASRGHLIVPRTRLEFGKYAASHSPVQQLGTVYLTLYEALNPLTLSKDYFNHFYFQFHTLAFHSQLQHVIPLPCINLCNAPLQCPPACYGAI